jgi:hypothetical protein
MKIFVTVVLTIFIFGLSDLYAQKCDRVFLSGKVIDTIQNQGFYNLMVVNSTTGRAVFGQPDGSLGGFESCKKGPNDSQKVVKTITLTSKMPGSSQD